MKLRIFFIQANSAAFAFCCVCALACASAAVASQQRAKGDESGDKPVVAIENFGKVNERFYRGAQPKPEQYQQLAALGVKTVVDLRADALPQARAAAEAAGLRYLNLPLHDKRYPPPEAAGEFLKLVNDQNHGTLFVHCKGGRHRTGAMTAVYRMTVDGWNVEQAFEEMKRYDFYTRRGHQCFKDYVYDYYRNLIKTQ